MSETQSTGGPSSGRAIHPLARPHKITNRQDTPASTAEGLVLCLDLHDTLQTETTSMDPRDGAKSAFGNGTLPATKDVQHGIAVVCTEVVAAGALCTVVSQGLIPGLVLSTGSATAEAGDPLAIDTAGKFELDTAAGEKYFAKFAVLEDTALTGTAALHQVLFNGWHGFGLNHGS